MTEADPDPDFDPAETLTVAISTLGERAGGIALPAPAPDIRYLILVQRADALAPEALVHRPDVTVQPLDTQGVAASRNAALDLAGTGYLMFGDDDVRLDPGGVRRLWQVLRDTSGLAVVTGRRAGPVGVRYADRGHALKLWNTAKTATPEILLRLAPVRAAGLTFDPDFGLGGRNGLGDEFVFLADLLKAGLAGRYEPVTIGHHPTPSTGTAWDDPRLIAARQAVLARVFGPWAPLWRLAFAAKHRRRLARAPGGLLGFVLGRTPPGA